MLKNHCVGAHLTHVFTLSHSFISVNIETNREGMEGKHLKFPIASHPKGPYKHHIVVRVDTGTDVNCMNEKTFNELFPEVQLSVCPMRYRISEI